MELVVVGSVGLDDVETPFGKVERALGGSAIYFSMAASYFTKPGMVGVVGSDFPAEGREILQRREVDLRGLETAEGETFRWAGRYSYDMNERETLFTELNVFQHFSPELPDDYRGAPLVFLGNIDPELQSAVLDQVRAPRFIAMDTMNFWIHGKRDALLSVLSRVDALLINDSEARELAETPNIVVAAQRIAAMGPRFLVIKRGEYGALLYHEGRFFYAPAFPLDDVRDPTGAGDAFAGGFMGHLAQTGELGWGTLCRALVAGSTMASFCVEAFSVERLEALQADAIAARSTAFRQLTEIEPLA